MNMIKPYIVLCGLLLAACDSDNSLTFQEVDLVTEDNNSFKALKKDKATKVFRAANSIVIDGLEDEWDDVPKRKMRQELDLGIPITSKFDLSTYFKMLWDDDNLYVFVSVQDEEINISGTELFEKDGVEIYLDGDNSKNVSQGPITFPPTAYDSNDDFFRFIPGESSALSAWGIIDPSNFEFEISTTSNGYNVEIKMPFTDLPDLSAESGNEFGLEFQVNDNDDDERQNALKWNSSLDESFYNPSIFGTAVLFMSITE